MLPPPRRVASRPARNVIVLRVPVGADLKTVADALLAEAACGVCGARSASGHAQWEASLRTAPDAPAVLVEWRCPAHRERKGDMSRHDPLAADDRLEPRS